MYVAIDRKHGKIRNVMGARPALLFTEIPENFALLAISVSQAEGALRVSAVRVKTSLLLAARVAPARSNLRWISFVY